MVRTFESHKSWTEWLSVELPPNSIPKQNAPKVLDLFAGCGGLALGFEAAGFRTVGYEILPVPVATYNRNLTGRCHEHKLDVGDEFDDADVVIGGPPCQPFSQFGYQRGKHDDRNGFPIFLDAVQRLQPKVAIIENVRGMLFRNRDYLTAVVRELERFGYSVDCRLLDAIAFGVPQRRQRVVIVASRCGWEWPEPVVAKPVTAGIALGNFAKRVWPDSRFLTPSMDAYVAGYEKKSRCVRPRDLHLDRPARTLTCRNLAGATADMQRIRLADGRRRMLEVCEAARLQSFPDWFEFQGTKIEALKQIGNSVAPLVGLALARKTMLALAGGSTTMAKTRKLCQLEFFVPDGNFEQVEQAINILKQIGVPLRDLTVRRRDRIAKALLAVAGVAPNGPWTAAKTLRHRAPLTSRAIIKLWNQHYGESFADSSYDDVRRKDLRLLVEFGLVQESAANPGADMNDGTRGYSLGEGAFRLLSAYDTDAWETELVAFRSSISNISDRLSKSRELKMIPLHLPDGRDA